MSLIFEEGVVWNFNVSAFKAFYFIFFPPPRGSPNGQSSLAADIKEIITEIQTFQIFLKSVWLHTLSVRPRFIFHHVKQESNISRTKKAGPQSYKQLSLQCNDLAGAHQIQTWMKDGASEPPTRLLYVPLHAAEFIKLSMWGEIKAPVLGDFPLLAYCLNMTASLFEYCANAWLGAYFSSGLRSQILSFFHTQMEVPSLSVFFFYFTSMLVKRYIQRLKYAFDKDEELIYGHTFIIAHS